MDKKGKKKVLHIAVKFLAVAMVLTGFFLASSLLENERITDVYMGVSK